MSKEGHVTINVVPVPSGQRWRRAYTRVPWYSFAVLVAYSLIFYDIPVDNQEYASTLVFDTDKARQAYRWWTYSLLHRRTLQLWINVSMTLLFGGLFEFDHGWWRTILAHNVSIVGGALACGWDHQFVHTHSHMLLTGSSGGIYGLLSALMGNLITNWTELSCEKRLFNISIMCAGIIADVVSNLIRSNPATAYSAHVGGFVTGAMIGSAIATNVKIISWGAAWKWSNIALLFMTFAAGILNLTL